MKKKPTSLIAALCGIALFSASAHAEKANFQVVPLQFEAPADAERANYQQIELIPEAEQVSDQLANGKTRRVSKKVYLSRRDIESSSIDIDEIGGFSVNLTFSRQGARKLAELTRHHPYRQLALIDPQHNELLAEPAIRGEITEGRVAISGGINSLQNARRIANAPEIETRLMAEEGNISDDYQNITFTVPSENSNTSDFVWAYRPLSIGAEDVDEWVVQWQSLPEVFDNRAGDFTEPFYYQIGIKLNPQGMAKWQQAEKQPFYLITNQAGKIHIKQAHLMSPDAINLNIAASLEEANEFVRQFK